jgi:hypothetical protein
MKFLSNLKKIYDIICWIIFIGLGLVGICVIGGLILGLARAWHENG